MRDPGSIPRGVLMWNRDSPVSVVTLQFITCINTREYHIRFGSIFELMVQGPLHGSPPSIKKSLAATVMVFFLILYPRGGGCHLIINFLFRIYDNQKLPICRLWQGTGAGKAFCIMLNCFHVENPLFKRQRLSSHNKLQSQIYDAQSCLSVGCVRVTDEIRISVSC